MAKDPEVVTVLSIDDTARVAHSVTFKRRADIQGLRAAAVLLVVVYHAGLGFPGGFVGVDIFFAISGFVITTMLARELETNGRLDFSRISDTRATGSLCEAEPSGSGIGDDFQRRRGPPTSGGKLIPLDA